jgi:hypothetical protein
LAVSVKKRRVQAAEAGVPEGIRIFSDRPCFLVSPLQPRKWRTQAFKQQTLLELGGVSTYFSTAGRMAGNTFGQFFRITTAGESHGPANVVIIDGVPAGLPLDADDLIPDLRPRTIEDHNATQRGRSPGDLSGRL